MRSFVDGRQRDGRIENAGSGCYCWADGNESRPDSNTTCRVGSNTAGACADIDGSIANVQKIGESRFIQSDIRYHRAFDTH